MGFSRGSCDQKIEFVLGFILTKWCLKTANNTIKWMEVGWSYLPQPLVWSNNTLFVLSSAIFLIRQIKLCLVRWSLHLVCRQVRGNRVFYIQIHLFPLCMLRRQSWSKYCHKWHPYLVRLTQTKLACLVVFLIVTSLTLCQTRYLQGTFLFLRTWSYGIYGKPFLFWTLPSHHSLAPQCLPSGDNRENQFS